MSKSQKDYYLRQQLKAIKKELGELKEDQPEPDDYRQRITESDMTAEAIEAALKPTRDGLDAADCGPDRILIQPEIEFSPLTASSKC